MNQIQKLNSSLTFSQEQVNLIKSQIAPKATDDELKLFLHQCSRTGLDPFSRQIYAIHRNTRDSNGNYVAKMSIQVSIDGFRAIAERSGDYAGQDEPKFTLDEKGNLISCSVTVYRFSPAGQRYPASVGVAFWDEYKQTDFKGNLSPMWAKMPRVMLSKVAEALALRKAYPADLSGLYTTEEMHQSTPPAPTEEMKEELIASLIDLEMTDDKRKIVFESISKCDDMAQFQKIKLRLDQFPKAIKLDDTIPMMEEPREIILDKVSDILEYEGKIQDKMIEKLSVNKPAPEVIKQINKKLKDIK